MKKMICLILCTIGAMGLWLWTLISICQPDSQPVSYYTPDFVESYTTGSFDELQICKVYCLSAEDSPDRISTEDFQQYEGCFSLIELTKESGAEADIYTAIFRETGPAS